MTVFEIIIATVLALQLPVAIAFGLAARLGSR